MFELILTVLPLTNFVLIIFLRLVSTRALRIGENEFLKAVCHVAEMVQKMLKDESTPRDIEITEKYVERCASIAGGSKYREFWNIFING